MCREADLKRKFKAGDKVRRTGKEHKGMKVGDIGTVVEFTGSKSIKLKEFGGIHSSDFFELAKPQVGDRVKIIKRGYDCSNADVASCCDNFVGREGIIIEPSHSIKENHSFVRIPGASRCSGFANDCLELISKGGSKMSKYEELKKRIEALDDGWNKEADDLLQEILDNFPNNNHWINIIVERVGESPNNSYGWIKVEGNDADVIIETIYFKSQCEKMQAFINILLKLLDKSNIKKDEKQEEIDKLKKELEDFRERTDKEIKKLESSQ